MSRHQSVWRWRAGVAGFALLSVSSQPAVGGSETGAETQRWFLSTEQALTVGALVVSLTRTRTFGYALASVNDRPVL